MRKLNYNSEIGDEISKLKEKEDLSYFTYTPGLLGFYFRNFYRFKLKATRLYVINHIYNLLEEIGENSGFDYKKFLAKKDVEQHFRDISNTIYRVSPEPNNIFYMMNQYLFLLDDCYEDLKKRILQEIETLNDQVSKLTQLYYQGDGKGRIVYINLYEEK
jgi:hypothetical protein